MTPAAAEPTPPDPAWCTTEHGATSHPDDEDHRSAGVAIRLHARPAGSRSTVVETDAEIGLLRRLDDATTWLVIEDGGTVHLEITLDSARRLLAAIRADPALGTALASGEWDGRGPDGAELDVGGG